MLRVVGLPAGAVGTDEEELSLAGLVRVGDPVGLPASGAGGAHPRALRAAEHADVSAGSAIGVHVYIIRLCGRKWYWPNGEHPARSEKDSRGATCRPGLDLRLATANIPGPGAVKTFPVAQCGRRHEVCGNLGVEHNEGVGVKGSQKPKSAQKKPAQKTLKERRSAKKAAAKIRGITE